MSEETPGLAELLEQEGLDRDTLRTVLASVHPVDLAEALDEVDLVDRIGEEKLSGIIDKMPDNAVADILDHLPHHMEKRVLDKVDTNRAVDLKVLRQYP